MKKIFLIIIISWFTKSLAQPTLVNASPYAEVSTIAYDSINNRIYYDILYGCQYWNIPCALTYSSGLNSLINKHRYWDNTVSTVLNSSFQITPPVFGVNNKSSASSRQMRCENNFIFTNYGYYFNKIDTVSLSTIWSYSPALNPSYKEVSTFEMKSDSVFFFEKDSTSSRNYYTLFVKNKLTGVDIPYNSLSAIAPFSSLGAIEGYIINSAIINNKIVLSGVFTASISGIQVARNFVTINPSTGQLQVPPIAFTSTTAIYDMKLNNNKIYLAGQFTDFGGQPRNNYAVLDSNLNLLGESVQFTGIGLFNPEASTWMDKIVFYDKYLIAKGYFAGIDYNYFSISNQYTVKIIDIETGNIVMPWPISLPGVPLYSEYTFQTVKNKLYIKNKWNAGSPFYIYCFEPIVRAPTILFPGSTIASPIPSIAICAPDNGNTNIFVAPIRYATSYNWTYSGANATIVPQGNGSSAKLIIDNTSTNGLLSVSGFNDCGFSTIPSTLNVIVKLKPTFTSPASPQLIICNPDSTLLLGTTTNTSASIWWRKNLTSTINPQPFYTKTQGNYYMVTLDNANGCKDSTLISVNNFNAAPNSKIISHVYPGAIIPIDTVTCNKPSVSIIAASDTAGVSITWKSIFNNSVFPNAYVTSSQNNLKIIVKRNNNNCVDSSLVVLVGQNTAKPNIAISNSIQTINCSFYTATLNAIFSPSNAFSIWNGPQSFTAANPANNTVSGKYYFSVTNTLTGCFQVDSVSVVSNNNLVLKSSNDTTVCKFSTANLISMRIGTLAGVTYSWNNGSLTNSTVVNPNSTANYIVFANGPGGCAGVDTVKVTIPPDIQDSIIGFRSCDNSNSGSILIYAKGGIPPYKYSVNNGVTFLSSNSFSNLAYGTYSLVTKDSIGCLKTSSVSLNAFSNLPVPKFLASTQNFKSDTIVLVDISIPKADSVQWLLPQQALKIGGNMFNPIITVSDTGSFLITMRSFYGACIINCAKQIRFGKADSLHATYNNANGIKSFNLYPNPNNGLFTITVEFYKKQNASIQAWDTSPLNFMQQNFYNIDSVTLPINLSHLQNGNYIIRVIGEYDAKNKPFIISK